MNMTDDLNLNAPPKKFEPATLNEIAAVVSRFRVGVLLCDVETDGADANAEQLFLLGLNALEQAERFFKLAALAQGKAR